MPGRSTPIPMCASLSPSASVTTGRVLTTARAAATATSCKSDTLQTEAKSNSTRRDVTDAVRHRGFLAAPVGGRGRTGERTRAQLTVRMPIIVITNGISIVLTARLTASPRRPVAAAKLTGGVGLPLRRARG